MKPGTKLKSAVCDTEVMVIRCGDDSQFECGGSPMVIERGELGVPDPAFAGGTIMGKRYTNSDGSAELLCIKPGAGSLASAGEPLQLKTAKPLPASD